MSNAHRGFASTIQPRPPSLSSTNPDRLTLTFTYDNDGRRSSLIDPAGARTTTLYDAAGQLTKLVNPLGQRTTYAYDDAGRRTYLTDPAGGRTTTVYDAVGNLTTLVNPLGQQTAYTYDAAGRRTFKFLPNSTRASYTYDAADQLTKVFDFKSSGAVVSGFLYAYNVAGNRIAMASSTGDSLLWKYDAATQLVSERLAGTTNYRHTFAYDPAGNRLLKNEDGARTTFTYDIANRLKYTLDGTGRTTYTFDADGNQRKVLDPLGDSTTSVWDYENRNTQVDLPSTEVVTFTYNSYHWRVSRNDGVDVTHYLHDLHRLLWETDEFGVPEIKHTHEPADYGNLVSRYEVSGAVTNFYHYDALGSTAALTDSGQVIEDTYVYQAFGQTTTTGTTDNPFQFVGQLGYQYDTNLGVHHTNRRDYGSYIARFLSEDPIGFESGDLNLYRYVGNDPVNSVDPSGERQIKCIIEARSAYKSFTYEQIVNCRDTQDAKACCIARPIRDEDVLYKTKLKTWSVIGAGPDVDRPEMMAREDAQERRRAELERRELEEQLLAQATEEVINGVNTGAAMETLHASGGVSKDNRLMDARCQKQRACGEDFHLSVVPGVSDSVTTDASILLKLTPSEVKTRITNRYNQLIEENDRPERRLNAIQFTLTIVGFIPGPIGVAADIANAAIYYYNGDVAAAGVSLASTLIPIAGAALISKLRKTVITANKTVAVGADAANASKTAANLTELCEKGATKEAANAPTEAAVLIKTADDGPDPLDVFENEGGALSTGPQIASKCAPKPEGRGVWDKGPAVRGEIIEKKLGQNLPQTFDVFDKFDNGIATSIKSMDLAADTYLKPGGITRVGQGYVDKVAEFKGATRGGFTLRPNQIKERVLEIAVPKCAKSPAQQNAIDDLMKYGKQRGVTVKITEVE